MHIQLRHGLVPEAGAGNFWILSCDLYEEKRIGERSPSVGLCIKHDYSTNKDGESEKPKVVLFFDGETRVVVTEDEYADMVADLLEHEDWPSDAAASDSLSDRYATEEYCKTVWGWNPLKKAEEMWKRWQAIKLLVTPSVTV